MIRVRRIAARYWSVRVGLHYFKLVVEYRWKCGAAGRWGERWRWQCGTKIGSGSGSDDAYVAGRTSHCAFNAEAFDQDKPVNVDLNTIVNRSNESKYRSRVHFEYHWHS